MFLISVDLLLLSSCLFLGLLLSARASVTVTNTQGLRFVRDTSFDGRQVTSDADRLQVVTTSLGRCTVTCAMHNWCSSFFYTNATGACSLHATTFVGPAFAQLSEGTQYFKQTEDWCPTTTPLVLYNRPAQMCVYFEVDTNSLASATANADNACVTRGMRLIHNISPFRMSAVLNMTTKNKHTINRSIFIGLKRTAPQQSTFEWIDGTALNTTAMAPFWEVYQPNGASTGQDCVVIRASVDSTLNDVSCGPHGFVCEKTRP